jgi:hypothetical protein
MKVIAVIEDPEELKTDHPTPRSKSDGPRLDLIPIASTDTFLRSGPSGDMCLFPMPIGS